MALTGALCVALHAVTGLTNKFQGPFGTPRCGKFVWSLADVEGSWRW